MNRHFRTTGQWLKAQGPFADVVVSSRIRLARSVQGYMFLTRLDPAARQILAMRSRDAIAASCGPLDYFDFADVSSLDRHILVERHLISKNMARAEGARGAAISEDEGVSIMVNEEDHLRLQVMRSGFQLNDAWEQASDLDDRLQRELPICYHPTLGYLTVCPTNVGTGIRVSLMLHMPAVRLTGELEKILRAARDMHLAIRGLYGEGTDALGDFFQISNQTTLGMSEIGIIEMMRDRILPRIIEAELQARRLLVREQTSELDDRVHRAVATLQAARVIGAEETLGLLSMVRLGIHTGRITWPTMHTVNELFLFTQSAHLQKLIGKRLEGQNRRVVRADFIREKLASTRPPGAA